MASLHAQQIEMLVACTCNCFSSVGSPGPTQTDVSLEFQIDRSGDRLCRLFLNMMLLFSAVKS